MCTFLLFRSVIQLIACARYINAKTSQFATHGQVIVSDLKMLYEYLYLLVVAIVTWNVDVAVIVYISFCGHFYIWGVNDLNCI
ncbi:hypothetical protein VIGAN_05238400 [Vigna angularis var. angularis]|uniref:Uncharacterized protein n=1 Tax=Vigna angularis var. angularis TaxID=157739 RepID=A0A0S3S7J3_PHAAN|nr:hypothetical protein VIGAN_05238400 [Vigna angularis var. angularis]